MEMKLELIAVPVSDADAAKDFYVNKVGFICDHDIPVSEDVRFIQLTPVGSACSIVLGDGITEMVPGSQKGLQVVVADVRATREQLLSSGVEASEIDEQDWGTFTYFSDPDGNAWAVQQMPSKEDLKKYA